MITRRRVSLVAALGLVGGVDARRRGSQLLPLLCCECGVRELGWLEGRNVEYRITEDQGDSSRIAATRIASLLASSLAR